MNSTTTTNLSWMQATDLVSLDTEPEEDFPVWTTLGYRSFRYATPPANTYLKTLRHLWALLDLGQARMLLNIVVQLTQTQVQKLLQVLKALSDGQLVVLAAMLNAALPMQFKAYVKVLSDAFLDRKLTCVAFSSSPASTQGVESFTAANFDKLQEDIGNTPGEVRTMIMDSYLESALTPRFLFPDQSPYNDIGHLFHGRIYPQAEYHALSALSRRLLQEYQPRYWLENTWVIGAGESFDTVRFLSRMEPDVANRIKSVHLSFSTSDVPGTVDLHHNITSSTQREQYPVDNLFVLACFAHFSSVKSTELQSTWWQKFSSICYLELDSLTLDLQDAYGPDKEFLANVDWIGTLPWFRHGTPRVFDIWVPPSESLVDIRAAFDAIQL